MDEKMVPAELPGKKIGEQQIQKWMQVLREYKKGKHSVDTRIINAESWWKLRNTTEEDRESDVQRAGFRSRSAWLHNVITNKHADAMEAYPEPVVLPREEGDRAEAKMLSAILPAIRSKTDLSAPGRTPCGRS